MKTRKIAYISLVVRVSQALLTQTFFQPDEYFQVLEPAHQFVFGYGDLTWEWKTRYPIRGVLYPSFYAVIYFLLKITRLDQTRALIWAPKILSGLFASITDIAVCRLTRRMLGPWFVSLTLTLSLLSFFHCLALVRSLSNALETSLTTLALSFWPWPGTPVLTWKSTLLPTCIAAFACAIRPTNAIIWIFMFAELVWRFRSNRGLTIIFGSVLLAGSSVLSIMVTMDSWYFGIPSFTAWNFIRLNISPISLFYGSNPWHYYFTQGVPILLTTTLPLFLHGLYLVRSSSILSPKWSASTQGSSLRLAAGLLFWTLCIYSLSGHKEWRFIHPILPLMHIICIFSLVTGRKESDTKHITVPALLLQPKGALLLLSLPGMIYVMLIHGRAQISVMGYLRNIEANVTVGYLMPCHSTPGMVYLHRSDASDHRWWSLGCEPPLGIENTTLYRDQTSEFYASPIEYLMNRFPSEVDTTFPPSLHPVSVPGVVSSEYTKGVMDSALYIDDWQHSWPVYLVMFRSLLVQDEGAVRTLIRAKGYTQVWATWNGFEEDEKRRGGVAVWKWEGLVD